MSKTIKIHEKVSIWQILEIDFPDNIDISDIEHIKNAIKNNQFTEMYMIERFPETEEHIQYDYDTIEYL